MARIPNIRHSFVGGLLSPHLMGRTDLQKYGTGCETLDNFIVKLQGDIIRRPGFRYICDAMGPSRLVPFIFSISQSYILEFGSGALRFYINDAQIQSGGVPYQISTPYITPTDDLWDLKFAQTGDIVYITHPNHPVMKLIRIADNNWQLIQPILNAPPAIQTDQDVGTQKSASITVSVVGTTATITASAPVFIQGDIGKSVVAGTGNAFITALSGTTATDPTTNATLYPIATATVVDPYDVNSYAVGIWKLRGSPSSYFSQGNTFTSGGRLYWLGSNLFGQNQFATIRATSLHPTDASWTQTVGQTTAPVPFNYQGTGTGFTDTFRTLDLGRYVFYSGGYGLVTQITDASTAQVYITSPPTLSEPNAWGNQLVAPGPPGAWHFEDSAFSPTNGYPRVCCFFQDRLWLASTLNNPTQVWGSATSAYEDFSPGQLASDGITFSINSGDFEPAQWMVVFQGNIMLGTFLSEYVLNGGAGQNVTSPGAPITPQNIDVIRQSRYGSDRVQAIQVDTDLIFVQRSRSKAFEMSFNLATSSYGARNLNILNDLVIPTVGSSSSTMPNVGFKEMVYAHEPYQIIWFTTYNGLLFGLTYDKPNDVWAWHAHPTNPDPLDVNSSDSYYSIASIPSSDTNNLFDEVWAVTNRIRNGVSIWQIELMDNALYMDSCTRTVFSSPVTQIATPQVGGVSYLAGRNVYVVADGALLPPITMPNNGVYRFPPGFSALDVQVGINYISHVVTTRPEGGKGTIQGLNKRWAKLWGRVYQSVGLALNQQPIPQRITANLLDKGTPVFTGDLSIINLGWDKDGRIDIKQTMPLPMDILSLFGIFEMGEN